MVLEVLPGEPIHWPGASGDSKYVVSDCPDDAPSFLHRVARQKEAEAQQRHDDAGQPATNLIAPGGHIERHRVVRTDQRVERDQIGERCGRIFRFRRGVETRDPEWR